jgi:hypothetical protein
LDSTALGGTLVGMQTAATAQQFSLIALKQNAEMQQAVVDLLGQAAEAGKALLPEGVGGSLDRSV